ncbi:MAG TPA: alpha-L-fucosidase [Anaerohalosphaeraceae bacterium]|nr:alpha-L-fucosidase [Anaerohalosphaeraceae bacterium]
MMRILLVSSVVFSIAAAGMAAERSLQETAALEQKLVSVVPSERQYAWQRKHDVYAFIHFGPNTFTGREWGTGTESPSVFHPTALDARQWARALKSAGMTMAVLTVKHHDGFCLWPSRYTEQSVKNSPWKDGKGDVVREFVDAVRAEGLEVGLYLSPADLFQLEHPNGYYGNGSPAVDSVIPTDPASFQSNPLNPRPAPREGFGAGATYRCKVDDYNRYFLNQLYELLTEYGPAAEVWFDGAVPKTKGGQKWALREWTELIRLLQPQAVIFNRGPDIRWAGNESGTAREIEWSVIGLDKPLEEFDWPDMTDPVLGDRDRLAKAAALHWYPAEANTSILPGWFYHDDNHMKTPEELMDLYERSVGRNASLILNIPPDKRGLFTEPAVATLKAFGELRQTRYGQNLAVGATASSASFLPDRLPSAAVDGDYETWWEAATASSADGPVMLHITLPRQVTFRRIVLQEQIRRSQRVEAFFVEAKGPDGRWTKLAEAAAIGYKRILAVPETSTTELRIHFVRYRVAPTVASIELYY